MMFFVVIICMIKTNFTCKADQKVGAKELSEATGADGENFKRGHLLSKNPGKRISVEMPAFVGKV